MTANAMASDRQKALESGMDDYLPKPVKQESLARTLEAWVQSEEAPSREENARNARHETAALDSAVLAGLRELGGDDLLSELAGLFLEDTPQRLEGLREAIENGDAPAVERTAHALKGSSANIGAVAMSELTAQLQDAGRGGVLSGAPELLERLEREFERVRAELAAEAAG